MNVQGKIRFLSVFDNEGIKYLAIVDGIRDRRNGLKYCMCISCKASFNIKPNGDVEKANLEEHTNKCFCISEENFSKFNDGSLFGKKLLNNKEYQSMKVPLLGKQMKCNKRKVDVEENIANKKQREDNMKPKNDGIDEIIDNKPKNDMIDDVEISSNVINIKPIIKNKTCPVYKKRRGRRSFEGACGGKPTYTERCLLKVDGKLQYCCNDCLKKKNKKERAQEDKKTKNQKGETDIAEKERVHHDCTCDQHCFGVEEKFSLKTTIQIPSLLIAAHHHYVYNKDNKEKYFRHLDLVPTLKLDSLNVLFVELFEISGYLFGSKTCSFLRNHIECHKSFEILLRCIMKVLESKQLKLCQGCDEKYTGIARDYLDRGVIVTEKDVETFIPNDCVGFLEKSSKSKCCEMCRKIKTTFRKAKQRNKK